ncbi:MAG: HEPN domain-containing protein [bacterium]|nr:HEPN domain-containing protein [bacterium]
MVTLKDAREVSNKIVKEFQPISVVVFGSVAREGKGEDLDLLVVSEDDKRTIKEFNKLLFKNIREYYKRFSIDPFVVSVSKLKECFFKGSLFLRLIQKEGKVLYMKDSIKQWLKQVDEDLKMANYLRKGNFFRGACYYSQQAIEKSLKVGLLQKGWELEKIHSIERLIVVAEEYNLTLKVNEEDIVFIDSIYRGRYPAEEGLLPLGEPVEEDAVRAVNVANEVVMEIKKHIK